MLLCGDLNLPGQRYSLVDDDLLAVLVQFGVEQHVEKPAHCAVGTNRQNVLNLVDTPFIEKPLSGLKTVSHTLCEADARCDDW